MVGCEGFVWWVWVEFAIVGDFRRAGEVGEVGEVGLILLLITLGIQEAFVTDLAA